MILSLFFVFKLLKLARDTYFDVRKSFQTASMSPHVVLLFLFLDD